MYFYNKFLANKQTNFFTEKKENFTPKSKNPVRPFSSMKENKLVRINTTNNNPTVINVNLLKREVTKDRIITLNVCKLY